VASRADADDLTQLTFEHALRACSRATAIGIKRITRGRVRLGYSRLQFLKDRDGDLPAGEAWGILFDREHGFRREPEDTKPRR
jgi:hypothetical protein